VQIKALEPAAGPAVFLRPAEKAEAAAAAALSVETPPRLSGAWQRWRIACGIAVLALVLGSAGWSWIGTQQRRALDPAQSAVAVKPAMVSGGVRVRSIYPVPDGGRVALVDGSWFQAGDEARKNAVLEILHSGTGKGPLEVRDYRARVRASVDSSGVLTLYPVPAER
jgi:hypothetical protein